MRHWKNKRFCRADSRRQNYWLWRLVQLFSNQRYWRFYAWLQFVAHALGNPATDKMRPSFFTAAIQMAWSASWRLMGGDLCRILIIVFQNSAAPKKPAMACSLPELAAKNPDLVLPSVLML
jgi:hypothetical protein